MDLWEMSLTPRALFRLPLVSRSCKTRIWTLSCPSLLSSWESLCMYTTPTCGPRWWTSCTTGSPLPTSATPGSPRCKICSSSTRWASRCWCDTCCGSMSTSNSLEAIPRSVHFTPLSPPLTPLTPLLPSLCPSLFLWCLASPLDERTKARVPDPLDLIRLASLFYFIPLGASMNG